MKKIICIIVATVAIVSCGSKSEDLAFKQDGVLRIFHYNVGVFNKSGYDSTDEIAAIIKEFQADVVSINELDSCNRRNNTYQLENLAAALGGWDFVFQKALDYKDGAYGIGIAADPSQLSDGRFVNTDGFIMPNFGAREHRAFVIAETDRYVLVSTHLEVETSYAREEQAKIITTKMKELYGDSEKPVFLAGDMNDEMPSAAIDELLKDWDLLSVHKNSFSAESPQICIDYIFALKNKAKVELVKANVIDNAKAGDVRKASDHLPIYVDVKI